MNALDNAGNECHVAYSDSAEICRVGRNRQEAIKACMKAIMEKKNGKIAGCFDFSETAEELDLTDMGMNRADQPQPAPSRATNYKAN
jgi:hypothetical protein